PEVTFEVPDANPEPTEEATEILIVEASEEATVTEEGSDLIPLEPTTMYIHPDGRINVRSGAGINFDIVGTANQNTPVTVLAQNGAGDWLQIRLPNGLQGWVLGDLLDSTPGRSNNS